MPTANGPISETSENLGNKEAFMIYSLTEMEKHFAGKKKCYSACCLNFQRNLVWCLEVRDCFHFKE